MSDTPQIKDLHTMAHMSMAKVHLLSQQGQIVWPGNPIDGKKIIVETKTPKTKHGFGKATTCYYLNEKDSPMFEDTKEFIKHYSVLTETNQDPQIQSS